MATTTPLMALQSWDQVGDIYDHTQLANNWSKVDQHDHTSGKGKQIPTAGIEDDAITAAKLASVPLIDTAQLIDGAVTTAKILDGTIIAGDLADNAIETAKIKDGAVTAAKITSEAWTTYVPTLTQPGTVTANVTSSRYSRIGRTIVWTFRLAVTGSGTSTNAITLTIPTTAAIASATAIGSGYIYKASGTRLVGAWHLPTTGTIQLVTYGSGVFQPVGVDPVITLALGDSVSGTVTYEAAS
jgi:hypothetical protein